MAPVVRPANILTNKVGFSPGFNSPAIIFLTGMYIPILIPAKMNYLWRPALSPLKRDFGPSSLEMVFIVPMKPEYLGTAPATDDFD